MNSPHITPSHDRRRLGLLLAAMTLVMLPHIGNLGALIMAYIGLLLAWRAAALFGLTAVPGRLVLFSLTLGGIAVVYAEYHRFYGREAGAALFTVGLALKLMELNSTRDVYLSVYLAFFVAITQYLFSQSIPMAAYTLAVAVLLVATLIGFNSPDPFGTRERIRLAGWMVAQALPLMVVLFVLFPRIAGPLWQLPDEELTASTGLSDTLEPGAITRLGLSQEPAFRVDFEGTLPPPSQRYWRGPVFWQTDGRRWSLIEETGIQPSKPQWQGPTYRYTITLEPHRQRWVLALDLPSAYPSELSQSADYWLVAKDKILERARYRMESHTLYRTGELSAREARLGLALPQPSSTRVLALARSWQTQTHDPAALVQRALGYFRAENFYYTLNPPALGDNPVDQFLFDTRRGFCEHYATAFVILMRTLGIPARVVTGYQGGRWNAVGRFLEVKQADAHAWAEVWLANQGWTRVDPTAAVAPERIERGLDLDTAITASEIRFNLPDGMVGRRLSGLESLRRGAHDLWASVDHAWDLWVLSYGTERQLRLLERLGIFDGWVLATWLAGGLGVAFGLAALWILPRRSRHPDRVMRIYRRFLTKLAKRGLVKRPGEGPLHFAVRAGQTFPELQTPIQRITLLFLSLRYGPTPRPEALHELKRLVRNVRV